MITCERVAGCACLHVLTFCSGITVGRLENFAPVSHMSFYCCRGSVRLGDLPECIKRLFRGDDSALDPCHVPMPRCDLGFHLPARPLRAGAPAPGLCANHLGSGTWMLDTSGQSQYFVAKIGKTMWRCSGPRKSFGEGAPSCRCHGLCLASS